MPLPRRVSRPPSAPSDALLIERCRRGDRAALETVFRSEARGLSQLITRLVGPTADAEDVLTETLLAATLAFPKYRGEATVSTWLASIAVRVVHRRWRNPERQRRVPLELVREPSDPAPGADRALQSRRHIERVYEHLDSIDEDKRMAFILHVVEGHAIEDVAALVGASKTATKSRIFWARRKLLGKARRDPGLRELLMELEAER